MIFEDLQAFILNYCMKIFNKLQFTKEDMKCEDYIF